MPPDASDAAPAPIVDASPVQTPCSAACATMARICGPQPADCVETMAHIDGARTIRTASGKPLTCAAVAAAQSKADLAAAGAACP
jgi:hypothetical protein